MAILAQERLRLATTVAMNTCLSVVSMRMWWERDQATITYSWNASDILSVI
jgi:hypothetical protein